jgi:hypothetical protein
VNWLSTLASTQPRISAGGRRRPSGTRWPPSTAASGGRPARARAACRGRWCGSRSGSRAACCRRTTTIAESPPGPSVIEVSTWIAIVRPGASSSSSPSVVRTNSVNPSAHGALLLAGRVAGQEDRDVAAQVLTQPRLVVVVAVEVGDVEVVGGSMRSSSSSLGAGRCGGRRTTSRRTPARTRDRRGSSRRRSRRGCRRGRST